jgi:hypothetical protein
LQNAVGNVTKLSYIKQIGDQDVARGHPVLTYDNYMEQLLLACSTYDKKLSLTGKQKRAVYQTEIDKYDSTDYPFDDTYDGGYEVTNRTTNQTAIWVLTQNCYQLSHERNKRASAARDKQR